MSSRGIAFRLGEFLIRRAVRRLPPEVRSEWSRTFAAELPAIMYDPDVRPAFRRQARMLLYAADSVRGAWRLRRMSAGAAPTAAGTVVRVAVAISVGSAAILTVGAITADIRLTLLLSEFTFGGVVLAAAILFVRVAMGRARRASRDDPPLGGA